jgi:MATE family multidrug resistance protein
MQRSFKVICRWAFEIVALLAGIIGDNHLAAQTIILNTSGLTYMLPMSLGIATSTRIGNSLGANLPFTSRNISNCAFILGFCLAVFNCIALLCVKDVWGRVYSSDDTIVALVSQTLPLAALFQLADGMGAVASGILRGCGRQKIGAGLNLSGYYIFGLPLGALFTFYFKMELIGIWLGLAIGMTYCACIEFYLVQTTDWKDMACKAIILVRTHSANPLEDYEDLEYEPIDGSAP